MRYVPPIRYFIYFWSFLASLSLGATLFLCECNNSCLGCSYSWYLYEQICWIYPLMFLISWLGLMFTIDMWSDARKK